MSKSLAARLREGETVVGTMYTELLSPAACHVAKGAGLDFIVLDTEHNFAGVESVAWMCRTGRDIGLSVIIRAPAFEGQWLSRYLDLGASGLLVPHVEDGAETEAIVRSIKFPPEGERGLGGGAHRDYGPTSPADLVRWENENLLLVVQIETRRGHKNRSEIMGTKGVDALFIGPNDLALSLGYPGQLEHPEVQQAMLDIFEAAENAGVAPGLHVFDVAGARYWLSRGARFLCYSSDVSLIERGCREALAQIRDNREV
ncbi:MAG: HpcH/HpaI aldolase/citrate lyase family protein [Armatimonadota bacterium]